MGVHLHSAFVVLLNIKHSLCIMTDCVALSHSSAMKSYHLTHSVLLQFGAFQIVCVYL